MTKLAFVHGWAEGAWSASRLAKSFKDAGFDLVPDPRTADVIISHSAGCYCSCGYSNAKLIVLIGLPLWPGKPVLISLIQKLVLEVAQHRSGELAWFSSKLGHNALYILANPLSLVVFFANKWRRKLPRPSQHQKILLIRNQNDRFSEPAACKKIAQELGYEYIEMPGLHDDCWIYPDAYVKKVKEYAAKLA